MSVKNKGGEPEAKQPVEPDAVVGEKGAGEVGAVGAAPRPSLMEPWNWLPEWFEHWRPVFGRRMPDLLTEMNLADTIRVEERRENGTVW